MSRIVQNNIVYSSGNDYIEFTATLPAGDTSLVFESTVIKSDSTIDVYPDIYTAQPTDELVTGKLLLTFEPQSEDMEVRVRISEGGGSSVRYPDGNDIYYPIVNPSQYNKLYKETSVNDIAVALGKTVKISEMADEVRSLQGGIHVTNVTITRVYIGE